MLASGSEVSHERKKFLQPTVTGAQLDCQPRGDPDDEVNGRDLWLENQQGDPP